MTQVNGEPSRSALAAKRSSSQLVIGGEAVALAERASAAAESGNAGQSTTDAAEALRRRARRPRCRAPRRAAHAGREDLAVGHVLAGLELGLVRARSARAAPRRRSRRAPAERRPQRGEQPGLPVDQRPVAVESQYVVAVPNPFRPRKRYSHMNITLSGATGLIGARSSSDSRPAATSVTVLSRSPEKAAQRLGVAAERWDPLAGPAPAAALAGRDAVVHLAGEPVAQRWSDDVKRAIRESRAAGHAQPRRRAGRRGAASRRPGVRLRRRVLRAARRRAPDGGRSGRGPTSWPPCAWSGSARRSRRQEHGVRVVVMRTGIVLDSSGGALKTMLTPFKLGVGGPVAGGDQYMPWIHVDDVAGMYVRAIDDAAWSGPVNVSAPEPVTNREFSKALGRALHRPAVAAGPGLALKALYGQMSEIVLEGQRAVPGEGARARLRVRAPRPRRGAAISAALDGRRASVAGGRRAGGGALALTAVGPAGVGLRPDQQPDRDARRC